MILTPILALRFVDRDGRKRLQYAVDYRTVKGVVKYVWLDTPYVPAHVENPLGLPLEDVET